MTRRLTALWLAGTLSLALAPGVARAQPAPGRDGGPPTRSRLDGGMTGDAAVRPATPPDLDAVRPATPPDLDAVRPATPPDLDAGPAPDAGARPPDAATGPKDAGAPSPAPGPEVEPAPAGRGPEPRPAEEPSIVPVPVPAVDPDLFDGLLPGLPVGGPWTVLGLLGLLAGAFVVSRTLRRLRDALPETGAIPWLADLLLTVIRLAILLLLVTLVARLLPASLSPALSWALLAAAVAIGWSARDVLADLVAGIVLAFERRIRRGVWLSLDGHAGIVELRGLRAVWLRDVLGHRIALPNRLLLSGAVVSEPGGAVHDVSLRLTVPGCPATRLRQCLHDAVLTSPWAQPEAGSIVRRDGNDPELWHVRARLIDVRFAMRFEGDLLERAEEILAEELGRVRAMEDEDWD